MLYFFKKRFMQISWHDDVPDKKFMHELYKKLKTAEYTEIDGTLESIEFSKIYFQDGTYQHDIHMTLIIRTALLHDTLGNHGGEGKEFENVIITSDVYQNVVLSDFFIVNIAVNADSGYAHMKAKARNYVKLKSSYADFINNFLKNKRIDTSMYPYDNDKDFLLL
jgi:hypothetical protein